MTRMGDQPASVLPATSAARFAAVFKAVRDRYNRLKANERGPIHPDAPPLCLARPTMLSVSDSATHRRSERRLSTPDICSRFSDQARRRRDGAASHRGRRSLARSSQRRVYSDDALPSGQRPARQPKPRSGPQLAPASYTPFTVATQHEMAPVGLSHGSACGGRKPRYPRWMTASIAYDVYRGTADRSLRLATLPGAGLPAHVKRKDWVLMPRGKPPFPYDVDRDVAAKGYCFFQLVD